MYWARYWLSHAREQWLATDRKWSCPSFTCKQFPPSLSGKPPRKSNCGEEADDECDDEIPISQRRKPAKKRRITKDATSSSKDESVSVSEIPSSSSESDTDFVLSSDPDESDRESHYSWLLTTCLLSYLLCKSNLKMSFYIEIRSFWSKVNMLWPKDVIMSAYCHIFHKPYVKYANYLINYAQHKKYIAEMDSTEKST